MRNFLIGVVLFIGLILTVYLFNEWLNSTVKVKNETIVIDGLPEEFEGYTILQFGDLHGAEFGEKQKRLIKLIQGLSYDAVAITGDMTDRHNPTLTPFFDLLDGIVDDRPIVFAKGNIDSDEDFIAIKEYGLEVMEKPYLIERNGKRLVFQRYDFYQKVDEAYESDVVIGVGHEPFPQDLGYDLILVGHYHAGQVRIPGYGALFVPTVEGKCQVTDQSQIVGVQLFDNYTQHITGGLGASADKKWMQKRVFNQPEINLITLVGMD